MMKSERGELPDRPAGRPVSDGRRATRLVWSIALVSIAMTPPAKLLADQPLAAYEDPAAAERPLESRAALSWGPEISVIAIDGSAPDPWASDRRAWLAPGRHGVYYFGTVPATGKCPPVTGDELAEFEAEAGRRYWIAARQSASEPESGPAPGCHIELTVADVTGPEPALGPSERLARARKLAIGRLRAQLQQIARAAAAGDPDASVNLALWYLFGDEPLPSPDPVAAQAWLVAAAERGSRRAESMRAELEPTLTAGQRQAAAERAASPPLPSLGAQDAQR